MLYMLKTYVSLLSGHASCSGSSGGDGGDGGSGCSSVGGCGFVNSILRRRP